MFGLRLHAHFSKLKTENKMKDYLLDKFFDPERWEYAIEKGVVKDMPIKTLKELTTPNIRLHIYSAMKNGAYRIAPPHTAEIPKPTEPGKFRTVYINEDIDRIILSIANDMFFEICPEMVHSRCKSYQKGMGCSATVEECVDVIKHLDSNEIGFKADLSKYFDSVPLKFIDGIFDRIEEKFGKSMLVKVIRDYYHSDYYFDTDGELKQKFQSLKQGCAVASFLADAVLYHLDERMCKVTQYWRYSDDILAVGGDYAKGMDILQEELAVMDMKLNPKKVEYLKKDKWFGFLGFAILGEKISLRIDRIKNFQKEVEDIVFSSKSTDSAIKRLNRWLYIGNGQFSWATACLSTINCRKDILELDKFVFDALRALKTGKREIGGLGYESVRTDGCVSRGKGKNVRMNRIKVPEKFDNLLSIGCMWRAKRTSREFYDTLVRTL